MGQVKPNLDLAQQFFGILYFILLKENGTEWMIIGIMIPDKPLDWFEVV